KAVDLVMFDLDGTLADTGHDLADAVNFTRAHLDLAPLPERLIYTHVGRGVEHLLKHAVPEERPEHFHEVLAVFLARYETHLLDRTALYPSVKAVLNYFCGRRRAVVSNKIERLTLAVVRGLGVAHQFDAILGGDSAAQKKPHPALLNSVLERFEIPAASALMVGDGDTDIEAGQRAGVITCGVTYGLGNKDDLIAARPDIVIDDLAELTDHFY
ncbi:MAG TPA: HAD-IA family hydrolase, partial [Candidatus Limnocylindria bacterium]|nr:HAD-IA family hydrolase [Candidatus Limnocylindria bacterium]